MEVSPLLTKKALIQYHLDKITCSFPPGLSRAQQQDSVVAAFRQYAYDTLSPRVSAYADHMGVSVTALKIIKAQGRWGSCCSKGIIRLNWQLVRLPQALSDYIIVHELAHRIHMNHSKAFWSCVGRTMPEYTLYKEQLKPYHLQWGYTFWKWRT